MEGGCGCGSDEAVTDGVVGGPFLGVPTADIRLIDPTDVDRMLLVSMLVPGLRSDMPKSQFGDARSEVEKPCADERGSWSRRRENEGDVEAGIGDGRVTVVSGGNPSTLSVGSREGASGPRTASEGDGRPVA